VSKPVWGGANIGKLINQPAKYVYYAAARGYLKNIRKVGNRLVCGDPDALLAEIAGLDDAAHAAANAAMTRSCARDPQQGC
jgi:hypothetical protein